MGVFTALAIASLVVAAGSAYMQNKAASAARRDQQKAAAVAQADTQVQRQNEIRQQVRSQRIRTAQIMQSSANTGTQASSGELGGIASLASQTGSNIGNIQGQMNSQNSIYNFQNAAMSEQGNAATWGAVGQIASSSFSVFSGTPQFKQSAEQAGAWLNSKF